jgi:hypothetical protein
MKMGITSQSLWRVGAAAALAFVGTAGCKDSSGPDTAPVALFFTVQPRNTAAGSTITPPVQVTARDAQGNTATGFTASVTVVLGANPGGGTLSGTTTVAAVAGIATFADLSIDRVGAGYTLTMSASGLTGATSAGFAITAGPVSTTNSSVTAAPTTITASSGASTSTITVTARDAHDNVIGAASVTVSVTGSSNTATPSSGTTNASGVFTAALSSTKVESKTVSVTINSLRLTQTATVTVTPALVSASQSTVTASPATITASTGSSASTISVTARDAMDNPVPGVTVALSVTGSGNAVTPSAATTDASGGFTATLSSAKAEPKAISATIDGAAVTQTASVMVEAAPASQLAFTGQPTNATAGAKIPPPVEITVQDGFGNTVPGATHGITVAITSGTGTSGATLGGTTTKPASGGVASFPDLSVDKAGTGYTLTAGAAGLSDATSATFDISAGEVSASQSAVSGSPSTIMASTGSSASTVSVTAEDALGNPISGASVALSVTGSSTTVTPSSGTTNASGVFTATLTSTKAESKTVSVTINGLPLTQTATVTVTPAVVSASQSTVSASPTTITASTGSSTSTVAVTAKDAFGNLVDAAGITLAVTGSQNALTPSAGTTDARGGFTATLSSTKAESKTVSATIDGVAITQSATVTVQAAPASKLAFAVQPTNTTAGAIIAPPVKVTAQDSFGNTATSFTGNVTVALGSNPGGGTLSGTTTMGAVNGVAVFTNLSIDKMGTGYTLAASASGLSSATSASFAITANGVSASQSAVTASPPTITASTGSSASTITVTAKDAFGNLISGASVAVAVTGLSNAVTPSSGTADGSGVFTATLSSTVAEAKTVSATINGVTIAQRDTVTVQAGPASQLAFTVQPSATVAGAAITPAVQVTVQDAFGNRVAPATNSVTMALGTNPVGGTLSGTKTVGAVNGVATFADLWIDKADTTGTGYTLTASAAQLVGATSTSFTITPNVATKLIFKVQPSDAEATAVITPAVQVALKDRFDNATASCGSFFCSVTVAIGTNPSGGTLSGTRTVNAVNGVATFADLRIDKAGSGYTLVASRGLLTGATSTPFDIRLGPHRKLAFLVQPSVVRTEASITPAVQVAVQDAGSNLVDTATTPVTIVIGANPPGDGTLGGTLTVSAVAGVATFSDLSIDKAGIGYTLTATAEGLTAAGSNAFTVIGPPAQLAFTGQPSSEIAGVAITPSVQVTVRDAAGSTVPDATTSVTVAIGTNPGGGTLSGTTVVGAVNGVATFGTLSIDKVGTGYTLVASATGLTAATSVPFNITAAVAAQLIFTVQPSNAEAMAVITPAVQVAMQDRFGNPTTSCVGFSCPIRVRIGANPAGGVLSGTTPVNAVNGVATFADLRIDKAGIGYTLVAWSSSFSVAEVSSAPFDIRVGRPTKLAFLVQPSVVRTEASITPAVRVVVQDAGGNRVDTATTAVTMQIGANPPGDGTLGGTLTVSAVAGMATFADLSIDKAGIGYTLTAIAQGLTAAGSNFFTVIGPPAQLAFTRQPSSEMAGVAITPSVQVTVRDAAGSTVPDATTSVTVAIGTNPVGGTLSGTKTVGAVNGVATFADLWIDKADTTGTGYTLTASAAQLVGATSASFTITPNVATKLIFKVQPSDAEAMAVITPAVQVTGQDAFGNTAPIPAFPNNALTVAITIGTGTSGATLSGTTTLFAVNGVATFADLRIDKAGTGYTLTVSRFGSTGATSAPFNIVTGAAASGP